MSVNDKIYNVKKIFERKTFMALFDKINDFAKAATEKTASFAKAATEKTENAIETGKLNSKINGEERSISAITLKIGEYFLGKLDSGEIFDSDVMNMYEGVKVCRSNIANFRKEIEAINVPKDAPACSCGEQPAPEQKKTECACNFGKEAAYGCSEAENGEKPASAEQPPCCNAALKAENDYKFCPLCGAKVEPEARFCPLCGAQL